MLDGDDGASAASSVVGVEHERHEKATPENRAGPIRAAL